MSKIIKINHVTFNEGIVSEHIYVFNGGDGVDIFNAEEERHMTQNKIEVTIIPKYIHLDDSIQVIKIKIMQYITKISFPEIYLYGIQKQKINLYTIYTELTQNEKIELKKDILFQFLMNFPSIDVEKLPNKEVYNYDDLVLLKLDETLQKIPIGQSFAIERKFHYTVDPFDTIIFDKILEKEAYNLITTQNRHLLFNMGKLHNNTIYFCSAIDVLEYAIQKSLSEETFIKVYFPRLEDEGILSASKLNQEKTNLRNTNRKYVTASFQNYNDDIDLFYKMFYTKTSELDYNYRGICQLNFIIKPEYPILIPLEILFKLFHTSETIPFIKYNPGNRFENIYRLYANKVSKNGKKIPSLSKSKISRLSKSLAKHKQVSLYILYEKDGRLYEIECSFEKLGHININVEFGNILNEDIAEEIIRDAINPLLSIVGDFLGQSGYSYIMFERFDNKNIIIKNISYASSVNLTSSLNIKKYSNCISSIFNIRQDNLKQKPSRAIIASLESSCSGGKRALPEVSGDAGVIVLQFKRTKNFNKMESQDAYITEMKQKDHTLEEIKNGLKSNFQLTEEEVELKLRSWAESIGIEISLHENRKLRIKRNPGFPVFIRKDKSSFSSKTIIIQVNNINDIFYLKILPIYLDTLIRLTQDSGSSSVSKAYINKLCKKTAKSIKKLEDIETSRPEIKEGEVVIPEDDDDDDDDDDEDGNSLYNILFGDDEEEEEEEEDLPEGEKIVESVIENGDEMDFGGIQFGGGPSNNESNSNFETEIEGKRLTNPNPFSKRLKDRDKALFLSRPKAGYSAYSRLCPSNIRRQPVILTDAEKERIDREHPGSYSYALKYGSKASKQHWYICPRYWCLTENTSLTEEEVKQGKCGGVDAIIPADAKHVPPGGQIYEFTSNKHKNSKGKYAEHGPAFIKGNPHPKDLCIPCCFKKWNTKTQQQRREQCLGGKKKKGKKIEADDYIKGFEKFPLEQGRWGFLPLEVQKFLQADEKKCFSNVIKRELKENKMCFLRHGVQRNENQSFLACITDIFSHMQKSGKYPTGALGISSIKEIIIDSIYLENFMTYQKGTLIKIFEDSEMEINIKKYERTTLYKNIKNKTYLKKVISAFENFKVFLRDDTVIIDYEYLWDIICTPNALLFPAGLNLVILQLTYNDPTNNIKFICPTHNRFFEERPTVFIVKKNAFFEPIYGYISEKDSIVIIPSFSLYQRNIPESMKNTLNWIKEFSEKCSPMASMPRTYSFIENISLTQLIQILRNKGFSIIKQVVNYNTKTIGVIAKKNLVGFIPCKPSSINNAFEYTFIDDDIWDNYKSTVEFLKEVSTLSNGDIPCLPKLKVLEDGLVVGIITITNQFIPLSVPNENLPDELETIRGYDYVLNDKANLLEEKVDEERILMSKMVKLETSFFNTFRNTIRILLQQYKNKKIRTEIENAIQQPYILYSDKLEIIEQLLKNLVQKHITFVQLSSEILANIDSLTNCLNMDKKTCAGKTYCLQEEGSCILLIPHKHLISGHDNKAIYFGRMADELIRYGRIRQFIFKPRNFINFQTINYDLNPNEIILLEHLLFKGDDGERGYFDDLVPAPHNPYIRNTKTFYNTQPNRTELKGKEIDRRINMGEKGEEKQGQCISPYGAVKGNVWKKIFKKKYQAISFDNTGICTWKFLAFILKRFLNRNIEIPDLKQELLDEYNSLNEWKKVYDVLQKQGKRRMMANIKGGSTNFERTLLSEEYYISNLDIFLMIKKYMIPTIFISGSNLKEAGANNPQKMISFLYTQDKLCIIHSPASVFNKPKKYSIIIKMNKVFFPLLKFPNEFRTMLPPSSHGFTFDDYYKRTVSVKYKVVGAHKLSERLVI